jgi:hypothetical protein
VARRNSDTLSATSAEDAVQTLTSSTVWFSWSGMVSVISVVSTPRSNKRCGLASSPCGDDSVVAKIAASTSAAASTRLSRATGSSPRSGAISSCTWPSSPRTQEFSPRVLIVPIARPKAAGGSSCGWARAQAATVSATKALNRASAFPLRARPAVHASSSAVPAQVISRHLRSD